MDYGRDIACNISTPNQSLYIKHDYVYQAAEYREKPVEESVELRVLLHVEPGNICPKGNNNNKLLIQKIKLIIRIIKFGKQSLRILRYMDVTGISKLLIDINFEEC